MGINRYQQLGFNSLGAVVSTVLLILFLTILAKVGFVMYKDFEISSALSALANKRGISQQDRTSIRKQFETQLHVDNVENVRSYSELLNFRKGPNGRQFELSYQGRVHLFGDFNLTIDFDHVMDASN